MPILASPWGDWRDDYQRWKADVLAVRLLPEYKLKKLWKLNFTPRDIEQNRHYEVFPQMRRAERKDESADDPTMRRGRALSDKGIDWRYARALRNEAEDLLRYHRLLPAQVARVRKDLARFSKLARTIKVKGA